MDRQATCKCPRALYATLIYLDFGDKMPMWCDQSIWRGNGDLITKRNVLDVKMFTAALSMDSLARAVPQMEGLSRHSFSPNSGGWYSIKVSETWLLLWFIRWTCSELTVFLLRPRSFFCAHATQASISYVQTCHIMITQIRLGPAHMTSPLTYFLL